MSIRQYDLIAIIESCGLTLTPAQYDQLWAYHGMLRAANADLNLVKRVRVTERVTIQIGATAQNLTNTEQFSNPNTNINSTSFGEQSWPRANTLISRCGSASNDFRCAPISRTPRLTRDVPALSCEEQRRRTS